MPRHTGSFPPTHHKIRRCTPRPHGVDSQLFQRRERIEHPGRQRCDLVGRKVASRVVRGANIVERGLARRVRV